MRPLQLCAIFLSPGKLFWFCFWSLLSEILSERDQFRVELWSFHFNYGCNSTHWNIWKFRKEAVPLSFVSFFQIKCFRRSLTFTSQYLGNEKPFNTSSVNVKLANPFFFLQIAVGVLSKYLQLSADFLAVYAFFAHTFNIPCTITSLHITSYMD